MQGNPLSGASVFVQIIKYYDSDITTADVPRVLTNDRGEWTCDSAPPDCKYVFLGASHPLCLDANGFLGLGPLPTRGNPDYKSLYASLKNRTHNLSLERGVPVIGTVRTADGKPIQASIAIGMEITSANGFPEIQTSDTGEFHFAARKNSRLILAAHAPGFASNITVVTPGENNDPLTSTSPSPRPTPSPSTSPIPQNQPIPNATIAIDGWSDPPARGQTIPGARDFPIVLVTDSNGNATWTEAPQQRIPSLHRRPRLPPQ